MDLHKVKPGDDFSFTAELYNLLIQMATDYQLSQSTLTKTSPKRPAVPVPTDVVLVQNTTSDNIERFRILGVDSALVEPSDNEPEFQRRTIFTGIQPTADSVGCWGVLLDSVTPGAIGRIAMIGVIQCWINLVSTSDTSVEAASGSYIPNSGSSGSAQILYVAGGVGTADATGNQWAIIKIGGGGGGGAIPSPEFQYQILTGIDNNPVWDVLRFGPSFS